jgi:rhodanese-related sulfurtransferase
MGFFSNLFGVQSTSNLKSIIEEGAYLVDVRTPAEFAEGHVKGSVNIPLDTIANNLQKFSNKKNIIVFCRSGNRSGQAKVILENSGLKNVTNGGTWLDVNKVVVE